MKLSYTVSEDDYIQYSIFHYENSKAGKSQRKIFLVLLVVGLLGLDYLMNGRISLTLMATLTIFCGIWFAFGKKLYRKFLAFLVKQQLSEGKRNEFTGFRTLELLRDTIRMVGEQRTVEVPYESVERLANDNERLYVYIGSMSAFIIPLSVFANEEENQEFLRILKEKSMNLTVD
jgi:hypothetical protein